MEQKQPIRVAQIVGKWVGGGLEAFLMNYYRNIDKEQIQFDFIADNDSLNLIPKDEIEALGGKVIEVPPYQHVFSYIKELKNIFKENNYLIVHSNINALSVFPLYAAKKAGVPIRIAHSHSTTNKKEWKKNLLKCVLRPFAKVYANEYFCCSEHAGRWLFGDKLFESGKVHIINNAIDVNKFSYNEDVRNKIQKELNIENKIVIGHIGRFVAQKNHEKVIDIFNDFHKNNKNSILLLIGDGPLKDDIKQKVIKLQLEDNVLFLGQKENINEYYQAMDLFLFPSLYEGFGMVMIEAECSNLPCVASTEVPKIVKINENVSFVNLFQDLDVWTSNITDVLMKTTRKDKSTEISKAGYSIQDETEKLLTLYKTMIDER